MTENFNLSNSFEYKMPQLSFESLSAFLQKFAEKQGAGQKNCHYDGISVSELEKFLNSFSSAWQKVQKEKQKSISAEAFIRFFDSFAPLLQQDRKTGRTLNIFDVLGLGHDEKRHCSFLAWLLDPRGSHGQGGLFFRTCFAHLPGCQLDEDAFAGNYAVRTELCPLRDMADRVDIVCEGRDFLCYIEAKIDTWEHDDQTNRYWKKLVTCANGRKTALIYLADGSRPACDSAIPLSWTTLAESLDKLRKDPPCELSPFLNDLVRQYVVFIQKFHNNR